MQNNICNTNLRFNLNKDQQRKAWEYLQTMNRQDFKSYSQVISIALVDYFDHYFEIRFQSSLWNAHRFLHERIPYEVGIKYAVA